MGLGSAGGCRGYIAKWKAKRLEFIPSLAPISYVFASLRAGLTKVFRHFQVDY